MDIHNVERNQLSHERQVNLHALIKMLSAPKTPERSPEQQIADKPYVLHTLRRSPDKYHVATPEEMQVVVASAHSTDDPEMHVFFEYVFTEKP